MPLVEEHVYEICEEEKMNTDNPYIRFANEMADQTDYSDYYKVEDNFDDDAGRDMRPYAIKQLIETAHFLTSEAKTYDWKFDVLLMCIETARLLASEKAVHPDRIRTAIGNLQTALSIVKKAEEMPHLYQQESEALEKTEEDRAKSSV